jgi:hypothetical protein
MSSKNCAEAACCCYLLNYVCCDYTNIARTSCKDVYDASSFKNDTGIQERERRNATVNCEV